MFTEQCTVTFICLVLWLFVCLGKFFRPLKALPSRISQGIAVNELLQMLQMFCDRWADLFLMWEVIRIPTVKQVTCSQKMALKHFVVSSTTLPGSHMPAYPMVVVTWIHC